MSAIVDNYHDAQQDILETFVDRGQLRKLAEPNHSGQWQAHPRPEARPSPAAWWSCMPWHDSANFAAGQGVRSIDLYPAVLQALEVKSSQYALASLRYDLWKLRAKGLVEKIPHSHRYRLIR